MRPKGSSSGHGQRATYIQNRAIYLRGEGWTLQQIGDMIGVSRAYVHQLLTTLPQTLERQQAMKESL